MRVSGKSLPRIIDDILDFSKIEAGKLEFPPEAASIAEVIRDVHDIYSGIASGKGLRLRHSTDARISPALLVGHVERFGGVLQHVARAGPGRHGAGIRQAVMCDSEQNAGAPARDTRPAS